MTITVWRAVVYYAAMQRRAGLVDTFNVASWLLVLHSFVNY